MVVQGGNNNMIVQGCPITQVMDKRDPCGPGNSPAVWLILNEVQLLYFLLSPQILLLNFCFCWNIIHNTQVGVH